MAALEHLVKDGPLTPSQLAGCLKVSTAAATQIVDRLERAGHVSRRRMDDDRRKIFVVPTEASIERAFEHFAPVINAMDETLARMTQAERQVVETFLDQVIAVYRNAATPPPASPENRLSPMPPPHPHAPRRLPTSGLALLALAGLSLSACTTPARQVDAKLPSAFEAPAGTPPWLPRHWINGGPPSTIRS
jgi:DNA-binding MarR family transcriptional regulator